MLQLLRFIFKGKAAKKDAASAASFYSQSTQKLTPK